MLRIKGNKEFVAWWEHWMARIHPPRPQASDPQSGKSRTKELTPDSRASLEPSSAPFCSADGRSPTR